jgi:hypothetical protein
VIAAPSLVSGEVSRTALLFSWGRFFEFFPVEKKRKGRPDALATRRYLGGYVTTRR